MNDVLKSLIRQFMPFAKQKMGFSKPPKLFLRQDQQNAANPLGKTGFYDPENEAITIYTTNRHPKDIMRSLAHELMHHTQKCNGDFENVQNMGEEGYAQSDPHMRTMEIQAYQASIVFRDWEDSTKGTIYYEHLQKGDKSSMSTKKWKNGELKSLLSEKWGFKMDLSKLNEGMEEECKHSETFNPSNGKCEPNDPVKESTEEEGLEEASRTDRKDRARPEGARRVDEDGCGMDHEGGMDDMEVMVVDDEEPDAEGLANQLLSVAQQIADMLGQEASVSSMGAHDEEEIVGEDSWPGKRDMDQHKSDLSEVVRKLHTAGYSKTQIKEFLGSAYSKALKG